MLRSSKGLIVLFLLFGLNLFGGEKAIAQTATDTLIRVPVASPVDSLKLYDSLKRKETRKVVLRSAIVPGWGQVTNKQAWKVPLVYAAIGIPIGIFAYNVKEYKRLRDAYRILADKDTMNDDQIPEDLKQVSPNSIRSYRDQFRQNVDYSALIILVAWGLNVVDAAVFANLRDFNVSDDLTLRLRPNVNPLAKSFGIGLTLQSRPKQKLPTSYSK